MGGKLRKAEEISLNLKKNCGYVVKKWQILNCSKMARSKLKCFKHVDRLMGLQKKPLSYFCQNLVDIYVKFLLVWDEKKGTFFAVKMPICNLKRAPVS